ncbi:butyrate kinase [Staphylococcus caeli]|uniref:butyrate kinase n=1 Tax=Staphylococcus caeli TaxID=2201815 RepID=UPI003F54A85E
MARILVLNLGSTSSKIAIYDDSLCVKSETIRHPLEVTSLSLVDQKTPRKKEIEYFINHAMNMQFDQIDAIACRGGLLKPILGGVYNVNDKMYEELKICKYGVHASNLSGIIGYEIAKLYGIPVFTVDPVVVDELIPIAKLTGIEGIERRSVFHALNQKAVARMYANSINKRYSDINVIVAHMGGGITVGAHKKGNVVDVNDGLLGEGPYSPERAGSIPNDQLYQFGYKHNFTPTEMNHFLSKEGGFISMFNTNDIQQLSTMYHTNSKVKLAIDGLAYQVAKAIGERATILQGKINQILLTGGLSHNKFINEHIQSYVDWIAPVTVYPGEKEMDALALRTIAVLNGNELAKAYS